MSNRPGLRRADRPRRSTGPTISASGRPATNPATRTPCTASGADVDAADDVVVRVAAQPAADLVLVAALVGDLDAEPDGEATVGPALGRLADVALPVRERGEPVGRHRRVEVHVVGDRELRDAALDGQGAVRLELRVRVGRADRVQVRVERQVAAVAEPGGDARQVDLVLDLGPLARVGRGVPEATAHPRDHAQLAADAVEAASARSSMSSVCAAVTIVRIRARSRATVGNTTDVANTPSSNSRSREPDRRLGVAEDHGRDRRLGACRCRSRAGRARP